MESSDELKVDRELRSRIVRGLAAADELQTRYRAPLERYLIGMCDQGDGRSMEKAVEIASQILGECFAKSPSLLEKWKGDGGLDAFLHRAAANRLKSWWSSAEKKRTDVDSDSLRIANAVADGAAAGSEELTMAVRALRDGVAKASAECPEGLVFLRLKGLHGIGQRVISECWGHHESQTSRRIKEAMEVIRSGAMAAAAGGGDVLEVDDFRRALVHSPDLLLGGTGTVVSTEDDRLLRELAGGADDAEIRRRSVEHMCGNPAALEHFARLLRRAEADAPVVVKDPALSGIQPRLDECIRRSLETLRPVEARGLIDPLMAATFADTLRAVGADGGTLWLPCPGEAVTEAVFNPLEPEIVGKRQPLVSGIVSVVLASGEPCCAGDVRAHADYSPAIDAALQKTTRSMIAVPFELAGAVRGVLTAVRIHRDDGFDEQETSIVERGSRVLAELFTSNLAKNIAS